MVNGTSHGNHARALEVEFTPTATNIQQIMPYLDFVLQQMHTALMALALRLMTLSPTHGRTREKPVKDFRNDTTRRQEEESKICFARTRLLEGALLELQAAIERLESHVSLNETKLKDTSDEEIKLAGLEALVPEEMEIYLTLNKNRLRTFEDTRLEIVTYVEAKFGLRIRDSKPNETVRTFWSNECWRNQLSCIWHGKRKMWEDCFWPKCLTPHSRKYAWDFSSNQPTWKMKMKIRRMKRKMRETVKSAEWRVEEYQYNNTMRMTHGWRARKTLEPMSRATLKCVLWNTRKCDVWGVLFTPSVGCSRLLSAVNDLTTTNLKNFVKILLWVSWWVSIQNKSPCSLRPLIPRAQR